jgi:two-component system LytT family sensor kinase
MSRTLRSVLVAVAVATFLGLLDVTRSSLGHLLQRMSPTPIDHVHQMLVLWATIILVSPWCAWMASRHPFRPGRAGRTLLAHAGGAAVFVGLHLALLIAVHVVVRGGHVPQSAPQLLHTYVFYVALEVGLYLGIVVVLTLLAAGHEPAARDVAAARLAERLAAARLEGLQAQIRPHFLFNTLNALAVLARRGDGAAVDRAIGDLGELLRASFAEPGRHEITLGEELAFLEGYVRLQRIRFPDRLDVEWRIEDAARAALVPALIVQPLVENAIEHGLERAQGGRLRVAARREGDDLEIEVADDGPGFGEAPGLGGGVGLANTRERLALLHGARGTLECGSVPGGGGRVVIRLPWRTA